MLWKGRHVRLSLNAWRVFVLASLLYSGNISAATLHNASYDWFTLQSEHFYVHYHEAWKILPVKPCRWLNRYT